VKEIFGSCPEVKKMLWEGEFWTSGYYVGTVGDHGDEKMMQQHVKNQRRNTENYQKIHEGNQLELFPYQNET
jgi:REP element-mobilizing transposase RayT